MLTTERNRSCDRCERDIHDLEPAGSISFGGAFGSQEVIVCSSCSDILVDWWNDRPTDKSEGPAGDSQ